jgi:indolepyruvate ferredoxin oxidoreductase beta subunit
MSAPISILLCALGGEGGGVLAGWLVSAARVAGLAAQATSIPGVAQRTGATTYYLEIYPERLPTGGARPVLGLNPLPGRLDLLVSSELLETARQVANGLPSSDRTMVLSNAARVLTTAEKMVMGDGRRDVDHLRDLVVANSHDHRLVDMTRLTAQAGTVMSAVMLGCIAGAGRLPLQREHFEAVLEGDSASAQASRRGYELGFKAVTQPANTEWRSVSRQGSRSGLADGGPAISEGSDAANLAAGSTQGTEAPDSGRGAVDAREVATAAAAVSPWAHEQAARFPVAVQPIASLGIQRMMDYQGAGYAALYAERLQSVLAAEGATVSGTHPVTLEAARWLALWMAFDDVIRVAALKSAASRLERVRREAGAGAHDLLRLYDHFKPGVPELAGLLPAPMARWLIERDRRRVARGLPAWALALRIGTHSVFGFLSLRLLASLRVARPWGSRYQSEQAAITSWVEAVIQGTREHPDLGLEIARCGRLIKGYGATNERGKRNLAHVLDHLTRPGSPALARAAAIASVREAALRDEAGRALDQALREHGAPPRPIEAKPVRWLKNPRTGRT